MHFYPFIFKASIYLGKSLFFGSGVRKVDRCLINGQWIVNFPSSHCNLSFQSFPTTFCITLDVLNLFWYKTFYVSFFFLTTFMFPIYVALHPLFAEMVHDYKGSYKALAKAKFSHIDKHVSVWITLIR